MERPIPQSISEVQANYKFGSYYWMFIQGYSKKMKPLIHLTKNKVSCEWLEECEQAFKILKGILIGPDIKAYTSDSEEFILDTDASLNIIGAVLS